MTLLELADLVADLIKKHGTETKVAVSAVFEGHAGF
jgi:hypothetical protein